MASNGVEAHDRCGFELPGMVQAALRRAREMEFTNACLPEQGRLLELLARGRSGGRIGECGTGCGIGLAWMVSAASATTRPRSPTGPRSTSWSWTLERKWTAGWILSICSRQGAAW